ncbi:MAG TPA: hypothetical protein VES02_05440 [Dermatophilaceae bacterium]|nr:hypothetical protein [Dermatophilaceae bacterium]
MSSTVTGRIGSVAKEMASSRARTFPKTARAVSSVSGSPLAHDGLAAGEPSNVRWGRLG